MSDIRTRLLDTIYATIKSDSISKDDLVKCNLIEDLEISSIDALEILLGVEREFDIIIEDDDLSQDLLSTFDNLLAYVNKRLPESSAA